MKSTFKICLRFCGDSAALSPIAMASRRVVCWRSEDEGFARVDTYTTVHKSPNEMNLKRRGLP